MSEGVGQRDQLLVRPVCHHLGMINNDVTCGTLIIHPSGRLSDEKHEDRQINMGTHFFFLTTLKSKLFPIVGTKLATIPFATNRQKDIINYLTQENRINIDRNTKRS